MITTSLSSILIRAGFEAHDKSLRLRAWAANWREQVTLFQNQTVKLKSTDDMIAYAVRLLSTLPRSKVLLPMSWAFVKYTLGCVSEPSFNCREWSVCGFLFTRTGSMK